MFSFDLRLLGIARILLGLIVIIDLIKRSFNLTTFYTDDGVFEGALRAPSHITSRRLRLAQIVFMTQQITEQCYECVHSSQPRREKCTYCFENSVYTFFRACHEKCKY